MKKGLNIGIFTDTYYPHVNGVATSIHMLETELTRLGHNVFIFTTSNPEIDALRRNVFRLPSIPLFFLPTPHRLVIMYSPKLIFKIRALKLDVIHTHTEFSLGFFGKAVSSAFRIPMVHTYHTMYEDYVHYIFGGALITPKMAQQFSRLFCNRAKTVIAPVEKTRHYLQEIGVTRPVVTIPTGLDFSLFSDESKKPFPKKELLATRRELGIAEKAPVVLTISRVAKEKSIDVLIKMLPKLLKLLPDAVLLVVGDGPYRETLESLTAQTGVQKSVIFAGEKPWATIGKYYKLGDVFATASTSETQGLTYIEAMATKIPVAVKRDPSFETLIVNGKTGYIFDTDEAAAEVIYHVLTNPKEVAAVTENGYKAIQPLSASQYALNVERVYYEVSK